MKKIFKSRIFLVIITAIICTTIGVTASVLYNASEIGFTPSDTNWKVNNLNDAINDLYDKSVFDLLWTNQNPNNSFAPQTVSIDLSNYKYVVVVTRNSSSNDILPRVGVLIPVNSVQDWWTGISASKTGTIRTEVSANSDGVTFGRGVNSAAQTDNTRIIPYKIYGVRTDLGLDLGLNN